MPRTCTICRHPQREDIDQGLVASVPYRNLAEKYGTSTATLQRHRPHMRRDLVQVHEAVEVARSERLLDCVRTGEGRAERMYGAAEEIMVRALSAQDLRTALQAIRTAVDVMGEARQYMELRGELTRELGKDRMPVIPLPQIVITREPDPLVPLALAPGPDFSSKPALASVLSVGPSPD
jgi:hypothetical protein